MKITNEPCGGDIGDNGICFCPVEGIINVLSKKWALAIIGTISNHGKIRFNKILKSLKGISPKTLADRLKELKEAGLLKRDAFPEIPPRVEYSLTQDGIEAKNAILPLMEWAYKRSLKEQEIS